MSGRESLALVTGAGGWLGRALVHALVLGLDDVPALAAPEPELRVRCLALPGEDVADLEALSPRVVVVRGDVTDEASLAPFLAGAGGAVLYHCAGVIHPRAVREFDAVNLHGTLRVLQGAEAAGVRRAVVVSSNSPLGNNPHPDHVFDEQSPYNPYMGYGASKMRMELAVRERSPHWGMEAVLIRAPWFYGPYQPARQTLFFQMVRDGKAPLVGPGDNRRSMAYVGNLCQGLLLAARVPGAAGQIYWIADRRPYPMAEIIDTIESVLRDEFGVPCKGGRLRLPSLAADVAGVVDGLLQRVGVYHQKIHVLSEMNKTIACSVDKAERELGYAPGVDLREGMIRSVAWLRSRPQTAGAL